MEEKIEKKDQNIFRRNSKPFLFVELAKPDENGYSRKVNISEFIEEYETLKFGNGGDWCRSDGTLAKRYNLDRIKDKGAIIAVQLFGFNIKNKISKQIRNDITKEITSQKCAILNIGNVEVDHKDGRRDDFENYKPENQHPDQFQPLSAATNKAKRQHCKDCRDTNKRFDASVLGYSRSTWTGDLNYRGTCEGCYWFDIKKFNQEISKGYRPEYEQN